MEFWGILNYLIVCKGIKTLSDIYKKVDTYMCEIKNSHPVEYQKLIKSTGGVEESNDTDIRRTLHPCIFLDENTKECTIYPVRPTICRAYGLTTSLGYCEKVGAAVSVGKKVGELPSSLILKYGQNIDWFFISAESIRIETRALPIAAWFFRYPQIHLKEKDKLYFYAVERTIDDYKQLLLDLSKKN